MCMCSVCGCYDEDEDEEAREEKEEEQKEEAMSLAGKTLVFTGTLAIDRKTATHVIYGSTQAEAAGAKVTGAVSAKTTHLVAGPGSGAKVAAAEAKGVTIWTFWQTSAEIEQTRIAKDILELRKFWNCKGSAGWSERCCLRRVFLNGMHH